MTAKAGEDLQAIFDYIQQDSPQNAAGMIRRLLDAMDSLAQLPHRYKVSEGSDAVGDDVRSMPVRPYLVRYHIDDAVLAVTILSVRHGARRTSTRE